MNVLELRQLLELNEVLLLEAIVTDNVIRMFELQLHRTLVKDMLLEALETELEQVLTMKKVG